MKKLISIISLCIIISMGTSSSQIKKQVTIKSGTIVPLEAISAIGGATANKGQTVDFRVTKNVDVDGITAIPLGSIAKGVVYEAKRSSWWGTKGRLGIKLQYVTIPSGDNISFSSSNVYITGKNRTPLSVITFLFVWPCAFICGSKAQMPIGYQSEATVASNTTVTIDNK